MMHQSVATRPADMCVDEIASANAPLLYFDGVPSFGLNGGVANLTLEAVVFSATDGAVTPRRVTIAHLRATLAGLSHLKAAIEGMELLAQPAQSRGRAS